MKKLLFLIMFLSLSLNSFALVQSSNNKQDDKNQSWAGLGHEIGTAVNESLSAVTTQAANFGNTSIGKITIAIVVYKIIGKDLTNLFIGLILIAVIIPIWLWSFWKNCLTRSILVGVSKEGLKTYEVINKCDRLDDPDNDKNVNVVFITRLIHAALLVCFSIMLVMLMSPTATS
jgi:hypothetical protein